ncbi:Mcm2-7 hexameric complex component, partial [Cladochytrium tenue]
MALASGATAAALAATSFANVNYQLDKERIQTFMTKFTAARKVLRDTGDDDSATTGFDSATPSFDKVVKYKEEIKLVSDREKSSIIIDLDDVKAFDPSDDSLLRNIENNTARYKTLFCEVIDDLLPVNSEPASFHTAALSFPDNPVDVILYQRQQRENIQVKQGDLPAGAKQKVHSVREVKGSALGRLVTIRGMVTRVSNVRPMVRVVAYSCDRCGYENFDEVTKPSYMPLSECQSDVCKKNKVRGKLYMQTRSTKFVKFQEVKLQELTDQVPMGHIPRSMTVHLFEDLTRQVSPGDVVKITGIFLPIPYVGFKAMRAGLLSDTYLEAQHIVQLKKQFTQMEPTEEISGRLRQLVNMPDGFTHLARSIAPEIYGHEDVKKALLLLLVGSPTLETGDGMKIRGDLNLCLMGDPGVAKSQLLKYISKVSPRGVYTTGRGSSGVGLTASVMRDPVTEEMVLEGGALVLADNGIACIDEFDKMDENDRTAIHEVMEQQTISISKAGITTTLNARTSILAAANPQFGRYNTRLKATENINLPAALLSRFDLLFLILDRPDFEDDVRLAAHVTYVHMHSRPADRTAGGGGPAQVDPTTLRYYISMAKTYQPKLRADTANFLVNAYTHLRQRPDYSELQYTCARTLLSLVRMASALARIRFSSTVEVGDVEEALRLVEVSKSSVNNKDQSRAEQV